MDKSVAKKAFRNGYGLNRSALIASGDINPKTLVREVAKAVEGLDSDHLEARRFTASYGELPKFAPGITRLRTPFASSVVQVLFPYPAGPHLFIPEYELIHELFAAGDSSSPINIVLREEKHLVYNVEETDLITPDGGYMGFIGETEPKMASRLVKAFQELFEDERVFSKERFRDVLDIVRGDAEMRPLHPHRQCSEAKEDVCSYGRVLGDDYLKGIAKCRRRDVIDLWHSIKDSIRFVVFGGK